MGTNCMAFLLAVVFLSSVSVFAQDTSSITGTIGDTTGGVLPGASVTIRNTSRGIERPTLTNSSGDYLVAGLPQGQYDITVSMKGFKTFQVNGVVLQGAQKLRLDV